MNWFLRNRYIFPMISIIFENRISFSKIGIKKLRKKNILSSRDINANIISRNFTEYSIYSPVRISHAKDARINNFSTLLFYLKIIFYFTILKILARSNRFECRFARRSTLPSITHTHTHTRMKFDGTHRFLGQYVYAPRWTQVCFSLTLRHHSRRISWNINKRGISKRYIPDLFSRVIFSEIVSSLSLFGRAVCLLVV